MKFTELSRIMSASRSGRRRLPISGGQAIRDYDPTVVRVEPNPGIVGYGEVCPIAPGFLPAHIHGVRAGMLSSALT